ncbi:MAG: peptidoglycan-binding protein, partial [Rhodospirillaceae bacterium]|nr:peptidoglycan-binding protein [Rhodospirillaceae bacterium]
AFENGDALLQQFGITTPLRVAHFLAQVLHETGGGTVLFENLNYTTARRLLQIFGVGNHSAAIRPEEVDSLLGQPEKLAERVYGLGNPDKARELGNVRPGDAFKYRGGGVLQTTGGGAYRRISDKTGVDFFGDPQLIVAAEHALKPALHEWDEGNLNAAADRNDIRTITRRINGGFNGLRERQEWLDKVWPLAGGGTTPPERAAEPDEETRWLQDALNRLGAQPRLEVDGRYGPATRAAVESFQRLAHLKVDGIAGDVTRAAIRLRLATIRGR